MDPVTSTAASAQISSGRTGLVSNFETFLQLLTAQVENQDPLSPLDSNDFTAQLTQMAGVEQQLLTNDLLTSLLAQGEGGLGSAAGYLGQEITASYAAGRTQEVTLHDGSVLYLENIFINYSQFCGPYFYLVCIV
jgi:flagellar basal-body rod modification protein FlgD